MRARLVTPAAAVAALVVAAALAAAFSQFSLDARDPWQRQPPTGESAELSRSPTPSPDAQPELPGVPIGNLLVVLFLAAVMVLAAVVITAWWRERRGVAGGRRRVRPLPGAEPAATSRQPDEPELVAAVDESLADLDGGGDPRTAVIACWVRLERLAESTGVASLPTDTTTDLVLRLLRHRQVSESVLADLAQTYRVARYSRHAVDQRMSRQAVSALRQLREALRSSSIRAPS